MRRTRWSSDSGSGSTSASGSGSSGLKRVRVRLEEAAADEDVRHEPAQALLARQPAEQLSPDGQRRRHLLEAEPRASSTRSISRRTSRARQYGTATSHEPSTPKPSRASRARCSSSGTSMPTTSSARAGRRRIRGRSGKSALTSAWPVQRAPRQLEQELGRVVRGRLRQLRRDALLPAGLRLGAHVQALAAPQHAELLEVRRLEEDRRRLGETSLSSPPMIPATATGRSASAITSSSRQRALGAVERADRLALACAADDDAPLRELRVVEGVERAAEREHHVVRDVDDVRDRPHPGAEQPRLQPARRIADGDVAEQPADVARAALQVVDADVDLLVRRDSAGAVPGHGRERHVQQGRDLAGDAVDGRQIGPVVAGLDLQHRVDERQHVGERRPRLVAAVEQHDPAVVGAELDLVLGDIEKKKKKKKNRIIPSETSPRTFRARASAGSTAPGSATATVAPAPKFQAPQTICARLAFADVDAA